MGGLLNQEISINTHEGLKLFGRLWQPVGPCEAFVCLVHGLGEHSGRYAHLAEYLTQARIAVVAFDLRGHGRSPGKRGHTPSYATLLDDIAALWEVAFDRYPGLPGFLYGHSLGGNLVINYALRRKPDCRGIVASAPALRLAFDPPRVKVILGQLMNVIWPAFSQASGLDVNLLSQDQQVVSAYESDSLVHDRVTARLFMGFFQAGLWALENARQLENDLLIMHGGQDGLTSPEASRQFAARAGARCMVKIWDNDYHEIHNEADKDQVLEFMTQWLQTRI